MQMEFSKIKYGIIFLSAVLLSTLSIAQKEGNIWYFGGNAGIDFNSGTPIALTNGALFTAEGCATISDNQGNLLFYTNGDSVWNKNHVSMPNGFGLMGHTSSTQTALIVPKPGNTDIYYIFTVPAQVDFGGNLGCWYSTIDMTLDGGLGDVINKNIFLHHPVTEKLTAVRHANGCDVWVIVHEWSSNGFLAYLVDSTGVNASAVISNVGSNHSGNGIIGFPNPSSIGQLKASPDGSKLALAFNSFTHPFGRVEIFDFNNATGVISNPLTFSISGNLGHVYGVEFSPDGTKLYVSRPAAGNINQYNLLAGSQTNINNSRTVIGSSAAMLGSLQLGPDGKIYCALSITQDPNNLIGNQYIGAINNPNTLGTACNYIDSAVFLNGKESFFGLPTFIQSHFYPQIKFLNTCLGDSTFFFITDANNPDSVLWTFNDPSSGSFNTSTNLNPVHVFSDTGIYNVGLTKYTECGTSIFSIKVPIINHLPEFSLGNDTILCPGQSLILKAETPGSTYLWQNGSTNNRFTASSTGIYWLEATNPCGSYRDSLDINYSLLEIYLGNDTLLCERASLLLDVTVPGASYYWQDNSTSNSYIVTEPGFYWVQVTNVHGCSNSDSITIDFSTLPAVGLGNDTVLCAEELFNLTVDIPGAIHEWQNGSSDSYFTVSSPGLYWVKVFNANGCSASDSITIEMRSLKADFGYEQIPCTNQIQFINLSTDTSFSYWDFGDGTTSNENNPLHRYQSNKEYTVILIIDPGSTCADTAQAIIPFEDDMVSDTLFIPNVFTPNGDGENDYFEIIGIDNPCNDIKQLTIFNRWGKKVFEAEGSEFKWDGRNNGNALAGGIYFYVLEGEEFKKSGSVALLR